MIIKTKISDLFPDTYEGSAKDIPVGLEFKYQGIPIGEVKRVDEEKGIVSIFIYNKYVNMLTRMFEFEGESSMEVES